jgi:hypothetical protein
VIITFILELIIRENILAILLTFVLYEAMLNLCRTWQDARKNLIINNLADFIRRCIRAKIGQIISDSLSGIEVFVSLRKKC